MDARFRVSLNLSGTVAGSRHGQPLAWLAHQGYAGFPLGEHSPCKGCCWLRVEL